MKSNIVIAYMIYLPVALGLTWYVARTLFHNAIIFMRDIFHGRNELAAATNDLFRIGFYLINLGFALYILKIGQDLPDARVTIEALSFKIGGFSIYLGIMLFMNLFLLFRGKKISRQKALQASVTPAQTLPS